MERIPSYEKTLLALIVLSLLLVELSNIFFGQYVYEWSGELTVYIQKWDTRVLDYSSYIVSLIGGELCIGIVAIYFY